MSIRILLYAHDGRGLGHVVRTAAIAEALVERWPMAEVIVVSGQRLLDAYIPDKCEVIKLPSYQTTETGGVFQTSSPTLSMSINKLTELRRKILVSLTLAFKPTILLSDFVSTGKRGELVDAISGLKAISPKSSVFLGLRPIIDDPEFALTDNLDYINLQFIKKYYNGILVYGHPNICDIYNEYSLNALDVPIYYTGFVVRPSLLSKAFSHHPHKKAIRLLIGFGSGYHSITISKRIAKAIELMKPQCKELSLKIICGPRLCAKTVTQHFSKIAQNGIDINIIQEIPSPSRVYNWATHYIGTGGSNTLMEILSLRKPAMMIARNQVENEQKLMFSRFAKVSSLRWLCEEDATTLNIFRELVKIVRTNKLSLARWMRFDGAIVAADTLIKGDMV